jgi:HAD superfamily hydrolase (TIGR01509 family)
MNTNFEGIIFDMDGTLTVPEIDFTKIRQELGVEKGLDLLEYPKQLNEIDRKNYFNKLEELEKKSYINLKFQEGLISTLYKFKNAHIKLSIITRNCESNTNYIINKLNIDFDPILTREFDHIKPHPQPIHHIISRWNIKPEKALIVGDFKDDILCGKNAGISTCFFQNKNKASYSELADFTINSYLELEDIIFNSK